MMRICLLLVAIVIFFAAAGQEISIGKELPRWQRGYLDLHHINTGRGSAAFYIFPDGTTMLLDAGEMSPLEPRTLSKRNASITPDSSRKPFQWIVHYIQKVAPAFNNKGIDYALITHFHDDHFGAWYPTAPASASGKFLLTGITGVGEMLQIKTLIDRGYPSYDYPPKQASGDKVAHVKFDRTLSNYLDFTKEKMLAGMQMAAFKAGSRTQVALLREPNSFDNFHIRNVKSNQWIWTGKDSASSDFTKRTAGQSPFIPDENSLSLALTINYGPFVYYTGGDNPGNLVTGDNPLRDVETPVSNAIGEVDIATMDHHGNRDAVNENMVRSFRPTVWIGQTWSSDHPGHEVLLRLTNQHLYPGPRDLFATNMLEANKIVIGPLIDRAYKSQQGHIVVRVSPGGEQYSIIILDDTRADMPVKSVFGPYTSRKNKRQL
jgi:beta-lactamase superfamily II metal-dependent hydrolase